MRRGWPQAVWRSPSGVWATVLASLTAGGDHGLLAPGSVTAGAPGRPIGPPLRGRRGVG
jgi:hypothetical protein